MRWSKYNLEGILNIKDRKIIHKAKDFAMKKLHLTLEGPIKDNIGIWSYLLRDKKGRKYFLVAKRYIAIINNKPIVSINEKIVNLCKDWGYYVLMYIEQGDYIYSFDPNKIISNHFKNRFNYQTMMNFSISLGKNMILTRTQIKKPLIESPLIKYIRGK